MMIDKDFKMLFINFHEKEKNINTKYRYCGECGRKIDRRESRSYFATVNETTGWFKARAYCKECSIPLISKYKEELIEQANGLKKATKYLEINKPLSDEDNTWKTFKHYCDDLSRYMTRYNKVCPDCKYFKVCMTHFHFPCFWNEKYQPSNEVLNAYIQAY